MNRHGGNIHATCTDIPLILSSSFTLRNSSSLADKVPSSINSRACPTTILDSAQINSISSLISTFSLSWPMSCRHSCFSYGASRICCNFCPDSCRDIYKDFRDKLQYRMPKKVLTFQIDFPPLRILASLNTLPPLRLPENSSCIEASREDHHRQL